MAASNAYRLPQDRDVALRVCEQLVRAEIERVDELGRADGRPELLEPRLEQLQFALQYVELELELLRRKRGAALDRPKVDRRFGRRGVSRA